MTTLPGFFSFAEGTFAAEKRRASAVARAATSDVAASSVTAITFLIFIGHPRNDRLPCSIPRCARLLLRLLRSFSWPCSPVHAPSQRPKPLSPERPQRSSSAARLWPERVRRRRRIL